jgi:hypothetical protein
MLEKRKGIPSLKGYYKSNIGRVFRYDSMTELAMMMHFDSMSFIWQKNTALRIPYLFEGKIRHYIPDFIVKERDRTSIIEIKGSNDKPELPFKCKAAEDYCKENNMRFALVPYLEVKALVDWNKVREYHYTNVGKINSK